jgi:opacity protein-like surface antigen
MIKAGRSIKAFVLVAFLLLTFLATSAQAVPVKINDNQVVQLDAEQLELLKREPGIYYVKYPPEKLLDYYSLVKIPDELGGGYFIAVPKDLVAALIAVGAVDKSEAAVTRQVTPTGERWMVTLYFGGAMPQDGDVDAKAHPFGVTLTDSAKVNYDNKYTFGGRFGYWSTDAGWAGFALDVSYLQLDASGINTDVLPVSALVMLRYPGKKLQPYIGVGPGIFFSDIDVDMQVSGENKKFSDHHVDVGLDARAGLSWRFYKGFAVFGEYRFAYYKGNYDDKISAGGTTTKVEIETDIKVHNLLFGVSYNF